MNFPDIPTATYRLQFHKGFTFRDAISRLPYLRKLGISHCYASPFFLAPPDSTHGYDLCDHNKLNPVIGSDEDFAAFAAALRDAGMKMIVDFVPNHMGITSELNGWWREVLELGPASRFARHFDIEWRPLKRELEGKVLLPVLGGQFGQILENGEIGVMYEGGAFCVRYHDRRFPSSPWSVAGLLSRVQESIAMDLDSAAELASICFALKHLPKGASSSESPGLVERETDIAKKRLDALCRQTPSVLAAIRHILARLNGSAGDRHSFDDLEHFLGEQCYRLSYWRTAAEEINYRRFFDINDLAAITMESPEVFEAAHGLIARLFREGVVTGLRIDHVDGLCDPRGYLERLQSLHRDVTGAGGADRSLYLVVEKILMGDEQLRPDWPVHGTTGYDFTNHSTEVLVDTSSRDLLTKTYFDFIGQPMDFSEIVYRNKLLVMNLSLASEINALGYKLDLLSECDRRYRDFTVNSLTNAVREVIACFPVYRTYFREGEELPEADRQIIVRAVNRAKRRNSATEESVFDYVRDILTMAIPSEEASNPSSLHLRLILTFQQGTGPIMAKALEDTSFYVFNRFVALNEVGGDPERFGITVEVFHQRNLTRLRDMPGTLLATSTHDTKRSEDVRCRIAAISEIPSIWAKAVRKWASAAHSHKQEIDGRLAPDANEEYLLYQTLAGAWPLSPLSEKTRPAFIERIQEYLVKAVREAKVNTSWIRPNEPWEEAIRSFIQAILTPGKHNRFLKTFEPVCAQLAELGAVNSLSQTILRCTCPGVPDTYQGAEIWDFSLVDPDNRRPVDYDSRAALLHQFAAPAEMLASWRDGRIKLFTLSTLLRLRRRNPAFFAPAMYEPLPASGSASASCIAFRRSFEKQTLIVITARFASKLGFPPLGEKWADTTVPCLAEGTLIDVFSKKEWEPGQLSLSSLLSDLPFAVLAHGLDAGAL